MLELKKLNWERESLKEQEDSLFMDAFCAKSTIQREQLTKQALKLKKRRKRLQKRIFNLINEL